MNDSAKIIDAVIPEECISIDGEFAYNGSKCEILEIGIVNFREGEVLNQRYCPKFLKTWDTNIHHIHPEDVKDKPHIQDRLIELQAIFDRSKYIVGFAVAENDVARLTQSRVKGLEEKQILELRDWFWIGYGLDHDLDYSAHINLHFCCESLQVEVDDSKTHGAYYDALISLLCFKKLLRDFIESSDKEFSSFKEVVEEFNQIFAEKKLAYDKAENKGYCAIYRNNNGYLLKVVKEEPGDSAYMIAKISVGSRKEALLHFSEMFKTVPTKNSIRFAKLTPQKLAQFKSYTNEYKPEEAQMLSKVLQLKRIWG